MERLLNQLMADRGITLAELTEMLGYQSKTSVVRVMKNQASQRALDTFARRVGENLHLTEQEKEALDEVLESLRWQKDYPASKEMLRFLRGEKDDNVQVWLESADGEAPVLFSECYLNAKDIRITMLNAQYVPIFGHLLELVRNYGAQIEHFLLMHTEPEHVIRAINALIPLIYEKGYMGYAHRAGAAALKQMAHGVLGGDVMVIRYTEENGSEWEDMIVFDSACHGFRQSLARPGSFKRMLGIRMDDFAPIKRAYFENNGIESYVDFSADYAKLERNRAVYKIKPDISIDWIPADISILSLQEGGIPGIEEMADVVEAMRCVYRDRVANTFEKRRVARTIMKRSAMVRFARTGKMSDHFWGMRAFTREERLTILRLLIDQVENNPYFNIYFLKDNDFLRDVEIAYYENVGILVLDANTDYDLGDNHSEIMIVHSEFMRMFKEYFERSLLAEQVDSHTETMDFLRDLVRIVLNDT